MTRPDAAPLAAAGPYCADCGHTVRHPARDCAHLACAACRAGKPIPKESQVDDRQPHHRFTITITPMTNAELQRVIDLVRETFGQKHLIHVIGRQPSNTWLGDAGWTVGRPKPAIR